MASQNQEIGIRGSELVLDAKFYSGIGVLADPDPLPTYTIKDPDGLVVTSGTGVKLSVGEYETVPYLLPEDAVISTNWKIEWTAYINGVLVPNAWEYFIVVAQGSIGFEGDILIAGEYMEQIKTVIGYPHVDLTEGDDPLITDQKIRTLCIKPALREYFKKFPKREVTLHPLSANSPIEIPFFDDYTFGAMDIKLLDDSQAVSTNSYGFWEMVSFNQGSSSVSGDMYGIKGFNPNGLRQQTISNYNSRNSQLKSLTAEMMDIDQDKRVITVYSSKKGIVQVDWSLFSHNFSDVRFQQIENVIKLSQAYLAKNVADFSSLLTDGSMDIGLDSDVLRSNYETLKEQVYEEWKEIEDSILFKL